MRPKVAGLRSVVAASVVIFAAALPQQSAAQTILTGQTEGGAHYKIMVPDNWSPANGLVIWNHGFDLNPIGPVNDLGPLLDVQLGEGYAVAASSFSLTGWSAFESHLDNQGMVQAFETEFGTPEQVLIYGASNGGLVTARDIEEGLIPNVVGAMPVCGALAGSRYWDAAVDLRLLYDHLCEEVPGAAISGGANGLPFPPDPAFDHAALAAAVDQCFGVLTTPSTEQAERLTQFLDLTGIPAEFVLTDMNYATFGLADLVYDPRKLAGLEAFGNANVDYGDAAVNADIERVVPDQNTRRQLIDNYSPTGNVGDVKIVAIHTDKDGLVIVENVSEYASVVPPQNLTSGIIFEDQPSHCDFTEGEIVSAWESLRGWVAGLPQPTVQNLQDTCEALYQGGLASGPCRYDPGFVIPDLNERVRLRDVCTPDEETLCLGDGGRFKTKISWEDFDGNTGDGSVAALRTPDSGSFWFFDPDNLEVSVKALDGRLVNGRHWIFYGSLTNVEFELTVTDTETGLVKVYNNQIGNFASVGDTTAFR